MLQCPEQFILSVRCFFGLRTFRYHGAQHQSGYGGYSDENLQKCSIVQRVMFYERSIPMRCSPDRYGCDQKCCDRRTKRAKTNSCPNHEGKCQKCQGIILHPKPQATSENCKTCRDEPKQQREWLNHA